jgi:hypothetical protein
MPRVMLTQSKCLIEIVANNEALRNTLGKQARERAVKTLVVS